jgi:hypothetical protein
MRDKPRRVLVNGDNFMGQVDIAVVGREADHRFVEHYDATTKKWKRVPFSYDESFRDRPGPTLVLDGDDAVELYLELHAFFSARGVRNKDESFTAGELAGTRKHLEDLRALLKLRKKEGE